MKSKPKISKLSLNLLGSKLSEAHLIASAAIDYVNK
jgi:hypothetical protein